MFGNVCLTRPGGVHQLPDSVLTLDQGIEQAQAHWLGERPEATGNEIQGERGPLLRGFDFLFSAHTKMDVDTSLCGYKVIHN